MNNKVGFRMWKSGKQWLFSGVALMASLVMGTATITANSHGGCQSVTGLRSQDQDTQQCVLWYPGTQTLSGSNGDRELPGLSGDESDFEEQFESFYDMGYHDAQNNLPPFQELEDESAQADYTRGYSLGTPDIDSGKPGWENWK